jgi:hypothetical protein
MPEMSGIWLDSNGNASRAVAIQMATCVNPAPPSPMILPAMSGTDGTELSTISTTRFSFSSVTDWSR